MKLWEDIFSSLCPLGYEVKFFNWRNSSHLAPGRLALWDKFLFYSHMHSHTSSGLMPGVLLIMMPLWICLSCASEAIGLASLYGSWFTSDSQHSVCSNLESIHCYFKAVNPSFLSFDYSVSLSQGREIEKLLPQSGHAGMQQTSIWNDG